MEIELQRALDPQVMRETDCAICDVRFRVESVLAQVTTDPDPDKNILCPSCIAVMGRLNPKRFPSFEEYRDAVLLYPDPVWPSAAEIMRLEKEGDREALNRGYWSSWLR